MDKYTKIEVEMPLLTGNEEDFVLVLLFVYGFVGYILWMLNKEL